MQMIEELKTKIEQMSKHHHIEILKILKKNPSIVLNENKSGVYVNIAFLPEQSINDISNYVNYIEEQEAVLSSTETQKRDFQNTFFSKKDKE
jgi:hypothetical protein